MKAQELRQLSRDDLLAREKEIEEELFHTRMKVHSGELENTAKLRTDRRTLARIKTLLSERK